MKYILILLFLTGCIDVPECEYFKVIEVGACKEDTFVTLGRCRVILEDNTRFNAYSPVMVGDLVSRNQTLCLSK